MLKDFLFSQIIHHSEGHWTADLFSVVFSQHSRAPCLCKDTVGPSFWKTNLIGLLLARQWSRGFAAGLTDYPSATGNKVNVWTRRWGNHLFPWKYYLFISLTKMCGAGVFH